MTSKKPHIFAALALIATLLLGASPASSDGHDCDQVERNGWTFIVSAGDDDTAALQCALDAASQLGSMPTILLPDAEYTIGFIDGADDQSVRIRGAGQGVTTINAPGLLDCVARQDDLGRVPWFNFIGGKVQLIDLDLKISDGASCAETWLEGPFFDFENVARTDFGTFVSMRTEPANECTGEGANTKRRGSLEARRVSFLSRNVEEINLTDFRPDSSGDAIIFGMVEQFGNEESFINPCLSPNLAGALLVTGSVFEGFGTGIVAEGVDGLVDVRNNEFRNNDSGIVVGSVAAGKVSVRNNTMKPIERPAQFGGVGFIKLFAFDGYEVGGHQVFVERNNIERPTRGDGIVVLGVPVGNTRIRNNTVRLADGGAAIVAIDLQKGTIAGNGVSGDPDVGIVVGAENVIVRANALGGARVADVILEEGSSDNVVVLDDDDTVIDDGDGNTIIGGAG